MQEILPDHTHMSQEKMFWKRQHGRLTLELHWERAVLVLLNTYISLNSGANSQYHVYPGKKVLMPWVLSWPNIFLMVPGLPEFSTQIVLMLPFFLALHRRFPDESFCWWAMTLMCKFLGLEGGPGVALCQRYV